jgi:hypothetical protein
MPIARTKILLQIIKKKSKRKIRKKIEIQEHTRSTSMSLLTFVDFTTLLPEKIIGLKELSQNELRDRQELFTIGRVK